MNIVELLRQRAVATPDKIALAHKGERLTYGELEQRSGAVADFFSHHGLSSQSKAVLFIPLSIDLYVLFLGLVRMGVTVVLIDPSAGKEHMEHSLRSVAPDAFIASPKAHLLRVYSAVRAIPAKFSTGIWLPGSRRVRYPEISRHIPDFVTPEDHPALITFTSGSTGIPKGICRTHAFLINQHRAIERSLCSQESDIELNTLPVFILSNLASGITTVIPDMDVRKPASVDAASIIGQIEGSGANRLLAAPSFCQNIAGYLCSENRLIRSVKKIYTGGGPVFPNLLQQLSRCFPDAEIVAVYGSTEAEPIAHISLDQISALQLEKMRRGEGLLTGTPTADITLTIIADNGEQPIGPFTKEEFAKLTLPAMSQGEIVVTGEHVQKRYISGDDGKTKFKVAESIWHRTGDAGYLDQEGQLWLLGRCTAKVVKHGHVIYPFGAEAAAMSFPEVAKAAFVEVNNQAVLVIETKGQNAAELCARIREKLEYVDSVRVVASIPVDKRHNSKVLYHELRDLLQSEI